MEKLIRYSKIVAACWGAHVGLTILLSVVLVFYDDWEHTLPFFFGYIYFGWLIPVAFWLLFGKLVNWKAK